MLWRPGPGGAVEVALVHRPRYDDWSLPKGKLDRGEGWREAAVREVREETGFDCVLGRALADSEYRVPVRGGGEAHKRVRWWTARCRGGAFTPHDEVDDLRWLPLADAVEQVSAGRDVAVLEDFARVPPDADVVLLVRHALAGDRRSWDGPDALRPLDARGRRQAEGLAALLPLHGARRVLSAPPLRCVQTAQPLADRLGVRVEVDPLLSDEGQAADPGSAAARVSGLPDGTVAVTQGRALPAVLADLGTQARPAPGKGAGRVLSLAGGRLRAADLLALDDA